jgi:hypothetical protein
MEHAFLILPLWLGAILLWSLGIYIIAQKKYPEFRTFAFTVIAAGIYCCGYAGELCSGDLETQLLWSKIQYIGVSTAPFFWLHFVTYYTGRRDLLNPFLRVLIAVFPILTITFKLFDENLHLIYVTVAVDREFNTLVFKTGPWYYVVQGYSYACGLAGMAILAGFGFKRMGLHRKNAYLLVLVTITPLISDIIYLSSDSPFGHLDISPYAMLVSVCIMYFAILKNDLVTLAPIARDFIFEHLPLCVLTFDNSRKLCEANESARAILALGPNCIGMDATEIFSEFQVRKMLPESGRTSFETTLNSRDFDVQTYILGNDGKKRAGWVVTMVDISEHKRAEIRLLQMLSKKNDEPDANAAGAEPKKD